ncbi:MAG TPA: methylated-DNA--[protein]-cysteine S-methyltransferase [Polyangia bacterium]|nr:methylated-DNA--[protein]-cysteine S-methyltransferase [Polyangia bacterium]
MNDAAFFTIAPSPVGPLTLLGAGDDLIGLYFDDDPNGAAARRGAVRDDRRLRAAVAQLDEYFAGRRTRFDLSLAPRGTAFRQEVWRALRRIPYGQTSSYGEIARAIGKPAASRAVGGANHHNPIAIVIPCHRVVGADGSMTGYGGGLDRKELLLALEARTAKRAA